MTYAAAVVAERIERLFSGYGLAVDIKSKEKGGNEEETRCPKAICGHRFPCPAVSILDFFYCEFLM